MLYYDRVDVSEGADANKGSVKKESSLTLMLFFDKGFMFRPDICNGCHDILIMSMNLSYISALDIHNVDDRCVINRISTSEEMGLLKKMQI